MVTYWGEGFWGIMPFTLQMVMILVSGYVLATTKAVQGLLRALTGLAKTPGQAVVLCTLIAFVACWVNWGFGLVVAAFTCREMNKTVPGVNYRVLVASGYSGFLVWHGGLSGSIPLLLATEGNFSQELMGGLIPLSQTIFSPLNWAALAGLFFILPTLNYFMSQGDSGHVEIAEDERAETVPVANTPAEKLENSRLVSILIAGLGFFYVGLRVFAGDFHLNLNTMNFCFLFLAILLHGRPRNFIQAVMESGQKVGPLLIQYPFYAGIMGVMTGSGLAVVLSEAFVAISNETTFPLFTFFSAGLVNLFIPSGGGQWAVQSTIVIPAAQELGVALPKVAMAVAWGDAWTNLAQPFWALPLLAIAGLKVRDIMGYCIMTLIASGVWLGALFLLF